MSTSSPADTVRLVVQTPHFPFDNTYARDLEGFYAPCDAEPAPSPRLLRLNRELASELGLDADALDSDVGAAIFAGNAVPSGARPLAQAYAGHQFGGFNPQLGDGRALLLGEVIDRHSKRRDIALKGSGRTPFSRRGDGKAGIGPVLREYLVGEAMHALGVPSTRALAAVLTGERVYRDPPQPGAVLARVAGSHLRVGTFEFFAARGETSRLTQLVDYALSRHYPQATHDTIEAPALALLQSVCNAQASLIAKWMHLGFIHGVMNTDNMTISGETIDYGPCAFMDRYDPATVFSSIDLHGRYAYVNQPRIAQWNLARLAQSLLPVVSSDEESAIEQVTKIVHAFPGTYEMRWVDGMRGKLGLVTQEPGDAALATTLLEAMHAQQCDFTLTFRALAAAQDGNDASAREQFADPQAWNGWAARWHERLARENTSAAQRASAMQAVNPAVIARNHLVEEALEAAIRDNDLAPFDALLAVVTNPFDDLPAGNRFTLPAPDGNPGYRTFCGT